MLCREMRPNSRRSRNKEPLGWISAVQYGLLLCPTQFVGGLEPTGSALSGRMGVIRRSNLRSQWRPRDGGLRLRLQPALLFSICSIRSRYLLARPISQHRIVCRNGAIRVTFVGEAIRGVNFGRRLTALLRRCPWRKRGSPAKQETALISNRQLVGPPTLGQGAEQSLFVRE
jgi:hypothetical protein